jgi:hypothetical protein
LHRRVAAWREQRVVCRPAAVLQPASSLEQVRRREPHPQAVPGHRRAAAEWAQQVHPWPAQRVQVASRDSAQARGELPALVQSWALHPPGAVWLQPVELRALKASQREHQAAAWLWRERQLAQARRAPLPGAELPSRERPKPAAEPQEHQPAERVRRGCPSVQAWV